MDDEKAAQGDRGETGAGREEWLGETLTHLADTLGETFELDQFLGVLVARCNEAVQGTEAGVLLADEQQRLHVAAASGRRSAAIQERAVQSGRGPSVEAFRLGRQVINVTVAPDRHHPGDPDDHAAHAFPIALRSEVIGVVTLVSASDRHLTPPEATLVQTMANMAAVGLINERRVRAVRHLAGQLQLALDSRVLIEQAKGILGERTGADMQAAFALLRGHARNHNQRIAEVAERVIRGELDIKPTVSAGVGVMTTDRRLRLRNAGLARWRAANVDALTQIERAAAASSVSAELRIKVEHDRALRVVDRERSAIDRRLSALGRMSRQRDRFAGQPRLLVANGRELDRARLLDALGRDLRLHVVADVGDGADALGLSIVEQPDLVVLDGTLPSISGLEIARQLGMYSPDTRRVLLVEPRDPMLRRRPGNVEAIFSRETDESALVDLLAHVVGL